MTPARYVEQARLEAAKLLLVTSEDSQECVARRAGFGTAETMRRIFHRNIGVSPGIYRTRFGTTGIERSRPASGLPVRVFP
jgi:transcriptional regulator GlxA family with amidase domain